MLVSEVFFLSLFFFFTFFFVDYMNVIYQGYKISPTLVNDVGNWKMVKVRDSLRAVMRFLHDSVTKWTSGIPLVALVVPIFPRPSYPW